MYDEKIWSSKILIPLWVVQISLQFVSMLFLSALLADETGTFSIIPSSDIIFMVCLIITLIIGPLEMLFQSLDLLEPWLYLCSQIFKVLFAIAFSANEFYRYFTLEHRHLFPLDQVAAFAWALVLNAGLGISLMLSFCASLAYGLVIWRRYCKSREYGYEKEQGPLDG